MVEIVAEISGNHNGSLERAKVLIRTAARVGCDYVKFQYYRPEDMPDANEGDNMKMYNKLMVPDDWLPELFAQAKRSSIGLFASVFSVRAVKELLEYDVPFVKIASPESTPLDSRVGTEIFDTVPSDVQVIWSFSNAEINTRMALYCPPGHPPEITESDFVTFRRGNFYGLSDHTPGIRTPLAFIRAGAKMIEKHFKLDGDNKCIDAAFSADEETMELLCKLAHR